MQKKIDIKLKQLQSWTYASDDSTVLQNLLTKLTDLEGEVVTGGWIGTMSILLKRKDKTN